jgi:hypothetical protein
MIFRKPLAAQLSRRALQGQVNHRNGKTTMRFESIQKNCRRGGVSRYVVTIVLLVLVIAGIAWVAQYLPSVSRTKAPPEPPRERLLAFTPEVAVWRTEKMIRTKEETPPTDGAKEPRGAKDVGYFMEYETETTGHYDFIFKNISSGNVEVLWYTSACDCASVQICQVADDEFERISKYQKEQPGEPLPYAKEPTWKDLPKDTSKASTVTLKQGEAGVVRIGWAARKAPGLPLNVSPGVVFQPVGDSARRQGQVLIVPIMVRQAVHFHPARLHVGVLTSGTNVSATLRAWSATRDKLDLKLATVGDDPLFALTTTPLSKEECADLEAELSKDSKTPTRIRAGALVTVQVHEKLKDQQLEQGSFYRKLSVYLDNIVQQQIVGPEIVGRVEGDVLIGGVQDQGKIRFEPFEASEEATKVVQLSADEKLMLEPYARQPGWLAVKLTRDEKNVSPGRRIWRLEVTVPANTPTVRSMVEPDAVTLRIAGTERYVRIPVEGHVKN